MIRFKTPLAMRSLARCPYRRLILSSVLCGLSLTFLCRYLCKREIPFVNYWKTVKLKQVYDARYESNDLSEENWSCWKIIIGDPEAGQYYPIKTNREIVKSLKAMNGSNVIESDPPPRYKQRRWKFHYDVRKIMVRTDRAKSPPPIHSPVFLGSTYVLVTREFASILFVNPEIQAFFKWSEDTYSPDEHICATLQRMAEVPGSIPYTPRLHRGDAPVLTRAVKWSVNAGDIAKGALYPPCTGRYRHQLCVYGSGDLHWIIQQKPLFANKFQPEVDNTALQCMEEYVRHRAIHGTGIYK